MSWKKCLAMFLFYFWLFSFLSVYSWEEVALPSQTTKLKEEEVMVNNQRLKSIYCRSSLTQDEIRNFYMRFLPGLGWDMGCPECSGQDKDSPLTFTKADDKIVILAKPDPLEKGKTALIITASKTKDAATSEPEKDVDSPGQDLSFIPRYPGSQRDAAIERNSGQKVMLVYNTIDPIGKVFDFYRQNMAEQGWNLVKNIDFQDFTNSPGLLSLPEEAKPRGGSLLFRGSYGECIVTVSAHPKEEGVNIIGINYNAK